MFAERNKGLRGTSKPINSRGGGKKKSNEALAMCLGPWWSRTKILRPADEQGKRSRRRLRIEEVIQYGRWFSQEQKERSYEIARAFCASRRCTWIDAMNKPGHCILWMNPFLLFSPYLFSRTVFSFIRRRLLNKVAANFSVPRICRFRIAQRFLFVRSKQKLD